jgi:heme/copper-type cytochrome/quinol oxidase subunit 2
MDATSPATATLAIWTIARAAAVAVLATEALFLWSRRRNANGAERPSRVFWALTPALILAGLCFWCTASVSARSAIGPQPSLAQLAR